MYIDSNYFTPAKSGESGDCVCKPDYEHEYYTTKGMSGQWDYNKWDKKEDDLVKGVEYTRHPVRHYI